MGNETPEVTMTVDGVEVSKTETVRLETTKMSEAELAQEREEQKRYELEDLVHSILRDKELVKETKERITLNQERVDELVSSMGLDEDIVFPLPNGEYGTIRKVVSHREVTDKDGIAQELLIAKDELKKPLDWVMLTSQGKLTPSTVSKHVHPETVIKTRIGRRKAKPRKKK